jgi:2,3-bisphosphoglycerate-dependent phosphoglycerate mutase
VTATAVGDDDFTPTRVVLVRHGESNSTVARTIGGPRTCSGLSALGRRQADLLRERLAASGEIDATALVASEYPRAIETAEVIAPALGLAVETDERFGEHDPGPECDGLSYDEFVARHGMPDWDGDPFATTFPGGETIAAFHHRVGAAFSEAVRTHAGGVVVIVCHGGVVNAIMRTVLRAPTTGGFDLFTLNTSITEVVRGRPDRWRLVRYNDAAHLAEPATESRRTSDA